MRSRITTLEQQPSIMHRNARGRYFTDVLTLTEVQTPYGYRLNLQSDVALLQLDTEAALELIDGLERFIERQGEDIA